MGFDRSRSCVGEHSVEGEDGSCLGFWVDGDDVVLYGLIIFSINSTQAIEDPEDVGLVDAVHGGAEALAVGEHFDFYASVFVLVGKAVDEVDFCADGPAGAWGGVGDGVDDELG